MMQILRSAVVAASAAIGMWAPFASAQYDDAPQPISLQAQLQALPGIELKGTIDRVQPELISLKCDGQAFLMRIDPSFTAVICNGTADPGYLKPGVMVRFEADLDKKWESKSAIEELTVVTPSETAQPGVHYDQPVGDNKDRAKKRTANDTYVVIGTIKLFKDNQLQVVAGGKTIRADVAKDAKIAVEIDDYSLAAKGDEISAKAKQVQPPSGQQPGQLFAQEVTITLDKPLPSSAKAPAKGKKPAKGANRATR